jgi:dolichol-phosphate mannosyltransferase
MKQPEPKNAMWESPGSTLVAAVIDRCDMRFAAISGLSMAIDLLVFQIFFALGAGLGPSQITSFFAGATLSFALNANGGASALKPSWIQWGLHCRFLLVALLALLLRIAVLMLLVGGWQWQPQTAILAAILVAAVVFQVGSIFFVYLRSDASESPAVRWPVITISVVTYALILKLIFMACINLIPEEAYYWNYAQHLDWGYLDHPPMVAWLIRLSTDLLGKSEFSVRLPAYICWIAAAIFMFRLTLNLYDQPTAFRTILLLAVLPIYFGLGFFMTPDAPLYAAWAGCLYFLERALVAQHRRAWWGVGACVGLGMLSKYTIALLGLGALTFVLIDRQSRRWLFRPEPYIAAITSLIIFSPVIFWNMRNDWMSFVFQSSDRWQGRYDFSLHLLIGTILLLLTPTGLLGVFRVLLPQKLAGENTAQTVMRRRQHLWSVTFTLAPLSIFVFYSLLYKPKINWTAPVWLAAIPLLAWEMVPLRGQVEGSFTRFVRRSWMPTIIALLIIHGASFYYISLGLPGAGPMTASRLFGEWRALASEVEMIKRRVELETGSKPVIVGMDKNFISSELSFYERDGARNTGGAHFFGNRSLMWVFWFPRSAAVGKNVLMVDLDRKQLMQPSLPQYFDTVGDVFEETLKKNGRVVGYFYWRVGHRYRG